MLAWVFLRNAPAKGQKILNRARALDLVAHRAACGEIVSLVSAGVVDPIQANCFDLAPAVGARLLPKGHELIVGQGERNAGRLGSGSIRSKASTRPLEKTGVTDPSPV